MKDTRNKRKRRSCYHRLRARYIEAERARRGNPAASAATQLLAIFAVMIGRLPLQTTAPVNARYTPPQLSPAAAQRREMARRLSVPVRYLDLILSQGQVPYAVLFNHIRQGGVLRRDALTELRKRAPSESLDWLGYVERYGLWSSFIRCLAANGREEDTNIDLLAATLVWMESNRTSTKIMLDHAKEHESSQGFSSTD